MYKAPQNKMGLQLFNVGRDAILVHSCMFFYNCVGIFNEYKCGRAQDDKQNWGHNLFYVGSDVIIVHICMVFYNYVWIRNRYKHDHVRRMCEKWGAKYCACDPSIHSQCPVYTIVKHSTARKTLTNPLRGRLVCKKWSSDKNSKIGKKCMYVAPKD